MKLINKIILSTFLTPLAAGVAAEQTQADKALAELMTTRANLTAEVSTLSPDKLVVFKRKMVEDANRFMQRVDAISNPSRVSAFNSENKA